MAAILLTTLIIDLTHWSLYDSNSRNVISRHMIHNKSMATSCEVALMWIPLNTCGKSTLVRVMAWHLQATDHYPNQSWPRYMSRNYVTRWQWLNSQSVFFPWWRHQMETFSALLALCEGNSPVTGEFSAQRPVTRSFDVFFDLRLNKRLSKQSWSWWFDTPSSPLWRHSNTLK